ncbi:14 kDa zinc-binding protein [Phtheirospermum japonicum]|uniref:14 kDa zinc-binding protein n=1 Tax=Phtheirospermum japonicum TaxID=374723 RepID=A0A830BHF3_9LAMI|nr:14 kDa zinc-binding protein [Phtheirospermum japonicum]
MKRLLLKLLPSMPVVGARQYLTRLSQRRSLQPLYTRMSRFLLFGILIRRLQFIFSLFQSYEMV